MAVTNKIANQRREKTCIGITSERKYFHPGNSFVKRSLRPSEWQVSAIKGTIHVPRLGNERLLNEAAALDYIRHNTNIPIPKLYSCFEDDGAVILVTEYINGVGMHELDDAQREIVRAELERHLETLHGLRSSRIGGPSGIVIPPYRATAATVRDDWNLQESLAEEYVFCHNDLSQQNVLVDPVSLRITAIIDWEYAGFFPAWFERRFFKRLGPSVALNGEDDDSRRIIEFLQTQVVCFGLEYWGQCALLTCSMVCSVTESLLMTCYEGHGITYSHAIEPSVRGQFYGGAGSDFARVTREIVVTIPVSGSVNPGRFL